jgi:hypothetical protein
LGVAGGAEQVDRFAGGDVGEPGLGVGEGAAGVGGGQEQAGEQVAGGEGPERVGGAAAADFLDEVVGEAGGFLDGGDCGQRVPPERSWLSGEVLRVEQPDPAAVLPVPVGGGPQVGPVGGGDDGSGGVQDGGYGQGGGFPGAGCHDGEEGVFPTCAQDGAVALAGDQSPDRDADGRAGQGAGVVVGQARPEPLGAACRRGSV